MPTITKGKGKRSGQQGRKRHQRKRSATRYMASPNVACQKDLDSLREQERLAVEHGIQRAEAEREVMEREGAAAGASNSSAEAVQQPRDRRNTDRRDSGAPAPKVDEEGSTVTGAGEVDDEPDDYTLVGGPAFKKEVALVPMQPSPRTGVDGPRAPEAVPMPKHAPPMRNDAWSLLSLLRPAASGVCPTVRVVLMPTVMPRALTALPLLCVERPLMCTDMVVYTPPRPIMAFLSPSSPCRPSIVIASPHTRHHHKQQQQQQGEAAMTGFDAEQQQQQEVIDVEEKKDLAEPQVTREPSFLEGVMETVREVWTAVLTWTSYGIGAVRSACRRLLSYWSAVGTRAM